LSFFGNQKTPGKIWLFSVGKAWLWKNIVKAAYSFTNLFWKESITMQSAQNIEKKLLLPEK